MNLELEYEREANEYFFRAIDLKNGNNCEKDIELARRFLAISWGYYKLAKKNSRMHFCSMLLSSTFGLTEYGAKIYTNRISTEIEFANSTLEKILKIAEE